MGTGADRKTSTSQEVAEDEKKRKFQGCAAMRRI